MANNIVVVGAGVIGLSTALELVRRGYNTHLISAGFGSKTCSGNAGAIWGPFLSEEDDRVFDWSFRTLNELREIADDGASGVSVVPGVLAADYETEMPEWFALLNQEHHYGGELPPGYVKAWRYTVPIIDMPAYLAWLEQSFITAGGQVGRQRVSSLDDLTSECDAVVNCTGLGAKNLCDDAELYPVKGQLIVIKNPGVSEFFAERGDMTNLFYWMPQGDKIVIGGTAEADFSHSEVDDHQVTRILTKAGEIDSGLKSAELISYRVGMRPCRNRVRFEFDERNPKLFHNYGHGGSGVSLSWGCAKDVATAVKREIGE